jgi:hypothetical protein
MPFVDVLCSSYLQSTSRGFSRIAMISGRVRRAAAGYPNGKEYWSSIRRMEEKYEV